MQQSSQLAAFFSAVLHIRAWEITHLPTSQSALAFDLLALVAHQTTAADPIPLKQLFLSLHPYSEAGVRKQLRRCLVEGWLRLSESDVDKRVRHVLAEPKLLELFERYAEVVNETHAARLVTSTKSPVA